MVLGKIAMAATGVSDFDEFLPKLVGGAGSDGGAAGVGLGLLGLGGLLSRHSVVDPDRNDVGN